MRIKFFALILTLGFAFLLSGLSYLQIFQHQKYKTMAEENRLKVVPLIAPRGSMFDRTGREIVKDVLSFDVSVVYHRIKDVDATADFLAETLDYEKGRIESSLERSSQEAFRPTVIASDLGVEEAIILQERGSEFPGVRLDLSARREYLYGTIAGNVIGYIGRINPEEFKKLSVYGYRRDDLIGRDGLEKQYEDYLRGRHGGQQIEVDHRGRVARVLGYKQPRKGNDIFLTIDLDLQLFCEDLLDGKKGSIIVMRPSSGAILAMVSAPGYDPGVFVSKAGHKEIKRLFADKDYPLMNRAIRGEYPPGSVFKLVVAAASLASGATSADTVFHCPGQFVLGRTVFRCWFSRGHGHLSMVEAIKHSCNVYFYQTGLKAGVEVINKYAQMFGFGHKSVLDLPFEKRGLLPSREWKQKVTGEAWYKGDTVNLSIGQGYLTVTPIQVARMTAAFANGGMIPRPYLVSSIAGADSGLRNVQDMGLPAEVISVVREGMRQVVNAPRGTGIKARNDKFLVSGKTGTAQAPGAPNHGWFTGFAPFDDPGIVVVVFDENGGKGGYYAAETSGKVFTKAHELGFLNLDHGTEVAR